MVYAITLVLTLTQIKSKMNPINQLHYESGSLATFANIHMPKPDLKYLK